MPPRAAIYVRTNLPPGSDHAARQEADCRAFADKLGVPADDIDVYRDEDTGLLLPALRELAARVEGREYQHVIVTSTDRIGRSPESITGFTATAELAGAVLHTTDGPRPVPARKVRAAIYARISQDRTGAGLGVARQEADCRQLAAQAGWEVVEVFVDNDVSAYSGKPRPAYEKMLAAIEAGDIRGVIVWHVDRLTRRTKELERIIDVAERTGCQFATVRSGDLDLSTPAGRAVARTIAAWARYEGEQKADRQRRKNIQRAEEGLPSGGGRRAYGYARDKVTPDPFEAELVREMYERVAAGQSVRSICMDLNRRGHKTVDGAAWSVSTMTRMLARPRYAGLREHRGVVVGDATWSGLVDRALWEKALAILSTHKNQPGNPTRARTYLLTGGMAICGVCGGKLYAHPNRGERAYLCAGRYLAGSQEGADSCGKIRVKAKYLEDHVAERVLARIATPETAQEITASISEREAVSDTAAVQIADLEQRLAELGRDYADRIIGKPEFLAARDRLTELLDSARRRSQFARAVPALPELDADALVMWWQETSDLAQRRAVVGLVVDKVVVNASPARGGRVFRPERVRIQWR